MAEDGKTTFWRTVLKVFWLEGLAGRAERWLKTGTGNGISAVWAIRLLAVFGTATLVFVLAPLQAAWVVLKGVPSDSLSVAQETTNWLFADDADRARNVAFLLGALVAPFGFWLAWRRTSTQMTNSPRAMPV